MLGICGCVDDIWLREADLCNLTNEIGRNCVDDFRAVTDLSVLCDCPNACNIEAFEVTETKSDWPTKLSFPRFLETILDASKNEPRLRKFLLKAIAEYNEDKNTLASNSISAVKSTFGRFTVFFPDRSLEVVTERPVYTIVDVLSSLGGLLGLYLGFSALTLLEIVDLILDVWQYGFVKISKISQQRDQSNSVLVVSGTATTDKKEMSNALQW